MFMENILATAKAIEECSIPGLGFNMMSWFQDRGTVFDLSGNNNKATSCMAGWALHVRDGCTKPGPVEIMDEHPCMAAKTFFGIDSDAASQLFRSRQITAREAVTTLKHLAKTGEVKFDTPAEVPYHMPDWAVRALRVLLPA